VIKLTDASFDVWGFIPSFVNEGDKRPLKEQLDRGYVSGWRPFKGFTLDKDTLTLTYPEDPPLKPIQIAAFRDEKIAIYPHAWVLVMSASGEWEVCRMD
jgi:hypothetical protein